MPTKSEKSEKGAKSKAIGAEARATRTIFHRALFLMCVFGICTFGVLVWKLYTIQIRDHDYYEERAVEQQTRSLTVSAERGNIYDAEGNVLAISATVQNVVLSPKDIQENNLDANLIASGLSELLGVDYDTVYAKTQKTGSQYEIVKRRIEQENEEKVRTFIKENKLSDGVYLEPDTKRYYPYGTLA
ncbi:MAG TPA: hypothetical protein PK597_04915, partial [Oscillospiraceae bacterium]|nr:hypothetical protein [Oscillospiraceae bacterium]